MLPEQWFSEAQEVSETFLSGMVHCTLVIYFASEMSPETTHASFSKIRPQRGYSSAGMQEQTDVSVVGIMDVGGNRCRAIISA